MRKRHTNEYVIDFLKQKNITTIDIYVDNSKLMNFRCDVCDNDWITVFGSICNGSGCPKCSIKRGAELRRYTQQEFIESLKSKKMTTTDIYINSHTHMNFVCDVCNHNWKTTLSSIKQGKGCPRCSTRRGTELRKYTQQEIEQFLVKKNVTTTDIYLNCKTYMNFQCDICNHSWKTIFDSIKRGTGCPRCNKLGKIQKQLFEILKEIFPNNDVYFNYKGFDWLRSKNKLELDIWIPELRLAIEYDGAQHFSEMGYWGGKEKLKRTKRIDKLKNKLISQHPEDIKYFIRFNYKQDITKELIINKLKELHIL